VIRAVVDTNVLISAMISPAGNEALILLGIRQALVKPYFSADILQEYAEVLARPKFQFPPDGIGALIELLNARGGRGTSSDHSHFHSAGSGR
jgi:putative PIN family toxin of toxin-antitoxin system